MTQTIRQALLVVVCGLLVAGSAQAQILGPPPADITPLLAADRVRPGTEARAAIRVSLAEGLHVNSNKPRDPALIPIVLTVEAPAGVTVEEIVYPEATDLAQHPCARGSRQRAGSPQAQQ